MYTCAGREMWGSLITHISMVTPMVAWDGPVGIGGWDNAIRIEGVEVCLSFNAFCMVGCF